jgi:signal transduction histidine kinase
MPLLQYHRRTRSGQQGAGGTRHLWILFATLAVFFFLSQPIGAEPQKEIRRVLILNEVGASYPGIRIINDGIQAALNDSPYRIEFYSEYMDTGLFPDPSDQQEFRDFYLRRYQNRKPHVIITVGPSALKFTQEVHQRAFPGVPIVFCLPQAGVPGAPALDSDFTGVENDMDPAKTLEIALRLRPGTEHVVVVNGGIADFDKQQLASIKEELKAFTSHPDITYLTELAMPDLLERLRHLPSHTLVLLATVSLDAAGTRFTSRDNGPIVDAANAPVFSLFDVHINHGEVGGYLSSLSEQGKVAGGMALRLLSGARPQDIPRVKSVGAYMFDWRALKRWGISGSDLPHGSVVLFREISVWERTKWIWATGLAIILGLSALAAYLLHSRKQLQLIRERETKLSGMLINAEEHERSRIASELHDDFSQRVAIIALGLENAEEATPASLPDLHKQLRELIDSTSELGVDLHTLSHRLHSSTIESLGLVPAVAALCREFTAQQHLQVEFTSDEISRTVHPDTSLGIFRIVQECLRNLKKHSGAQQALVSLRVNAGKLNVSVLDKGCGFDTSELSHKEGLGVRTMEERVRSLGGEFVIQSAPGKGTIVNVRVPIAAKGLAAQGSK